MGAKLDINMIHSLNLFSRITGVRTEYCFKYSNWLIFVVPPAVLPKAIGERGENVRKIGSILKCKVKVIPSANIEPFVKAVIYPIKFKKLMHENGEIVIVAGPNSKASLIGRDKIRMNELLNILKQYFNIRALKIV